MSLRKRYAVAIVGATGAVGTEMLRLLEQRRFPVKSVRLLASSRSEGKRLRIDGRLCKVETLSRHSFHGIDLVLFSAGASRSLEFAPEAVKQGALVVDNSSAFRMDPTVPLVVPEVNAHTLRTHPGIIANPNCSTIILTVALKPLHDAAGLRRVGVATYQSVSGAGSKAMHQLWRESRAIARRWSHYQPSSAVRDVENCVQGPLSGNTILPQRIAYNLIPQIDVFLSEGDTKGYTKEEWKMREESRKILELPALRVSATCVRVPIYLAHSEAVSAEFERPIPPEEARKRLRNAPGVRVIDDPTRGRYPMPIEAGGCDEVFVGRIRQDPDDSKTLHLWIVGDNLRKGAATNALQIAELFAKTNRFA